VIVIKQKKGYEQIFLPQYIDRLKFGQRRWTDSKTFMLYFIKLFPIMQVAGDKRQRYTRKLPL
jgi:hypothetical protein